MSYESVDVLQQTLSKDVFHYAKDTKKAAGRALGTLVEIISFYLLKTWGYENHIAIEQRIPEYANPGLTHNVEFTLHPTKNIGKVRLKEVDLPFTAKKIIKLISVADWRDGKIKATRLLSKARLLRNSCIIYEHNGYLVMAHLEDKEEEVWNISVENLHSHPFAMFECKRVGVEEGVKKGPQTIEKAKQGAYVARTVSSLQKLRMADGSLYGALHLASGELRYKPYTEFLKTVINSNDSDLLRNFILTVGIVSNHGNWFTSEDHNKELKVLSQSYDWLLFLTDVGLVRFANDLLLSPSKKYEVIREAFINSYTGEKSGNKFTKVQILLAADKAIQNYFMENLVEIEKWFNVISPANMTTRELRSDLDVLASKDWEEILK